MSNFIEVKLKQDDPEMNLLQGDILKVKPYWLDPSEKWTVIERVRDGFDPMCNLYRHQVEKIQ